MGGRQTRGFFLRAVLMGKGKVEAVGRGKGESEEAEVASCTWMNWYSLPGHTQRQEGKGERKEKKKRAPSSSSMSLTNSSPLFTVFGRGNGPRKDKNEGHRERGKKGPRQKRG